MRGLGWYDFFGDFPFWPMYMNGQGATARKLEPDRFRRTTEGGGPRYPTYDLSGLCAISINAASRIFHVPQHFLADDRPEMTAWLRARGLLHPPPLSPGISKFPKEVKPRLQDVMRDLAILRRAARVLGLPIYVFGDDAKDFFNQLAMASSELHKLGIVFLAADGELGHVPEHAPSRDGIQLVFVSEKRLGFGTHGASNIAQRFANALLDMFRDDMDEADAEVRARGVSEAEATWLTQRQHVQDTTGEPCHQARRFEEHGERASGARVCPNQRLYSCYMWTDDPIFIVVGAERAVRALRLWRALTLSVRLIMAAAIKRSLGAWTLWLGIILIPALGLLVVPRDKILRASASISAVLSDGADFHVYRALCGLLEFLRAVNLRGRNIMHGLYAPHQPDGASRFGPSGRVVCDDLMRKQLERWLSLLASSCVTNVKRAISREELELKPSLFFHLCSDAMYEGTEAGLGGFCHGLFWTFEVPADHLPDLSIPILEFLGVCFNILVFFPRLRRLLDANPNAAVVLRTDSLTAALTLPAESQRSALLVAAYQWLIARPEFAALRSRALCAHLFGDANPQSDTLSRKRWREFRRRCQLLGVRPSPVDLPHAAHELYALIHRTARSRAFHAGSRDLPETFFHRRFGPSAPQPPAHRRLELAALPPTTPETRPASREQAPGSFLQRRFGTPERPAPNSAATAVPAPDTTAPAPQSWSMASHAHVAAATQPTTPALPMRVARTSPRDAAPAPRTRNIKGLAMPCMPPKQIAATPLADAAKHYARVRVKAMAAGDGDMALRADVVTLMEVGDAVQESVDYGINANTNQKDERAWMFWEQVCEHQGTSPLRTAQDVRDHPDKQAHLLAVLLLFAFAVCVPTDRSRAFVKPRSALAYPLAIIRIFGRWGIAMPGYKALVAAMNGLMRLYIAYHGPHSLAPRRAEPMKFSMMEAIFLVGLASAVTIGRWTWTDADHDVFMFRRLNVFLMHTAFRLGEIVWHTSGEVMYITRACLVWCIGGAFITDPTPAQLYTMRPGIDYASVAPSRSKPDQWGEIHCPFPVTLTYDDRPSNPAALLRDIEIHCPCHGTDRETTPLFADRSGAPYTHHYLSSMLTAVLTFLYGAAAARLYTFHSYRSGLATALHAAGVPDPMIQLICRWMCPESLHVYRRMGTREHEQHLRNAARANVDVIQSVNVVRVAADEGYGDLVAGLQGARGREAQRDYEHARQLASAPAAPTSAPTPARATAGEAHSSHNSSTATARQHPSTPVKLANKAERPLTLCNSAPTPPTAAPELMDITTPLRKGDAVFIPCSVWPAEACDEHGGLGWAAHVVSASKHATMVEFTYARAPDGAQFADERLATTALKQLVTVSEAPTPPRPRSLSSADFRCGMLPSPFYDLNDTSDEDEPPTEEQPAATEAATDAAAAQAAAGAADDEHPYAEFDAAIMAQLALPMLAPLIATSADHAIHEEPQPVLLPSFPNYADALAAANATTDAASSNEPPPPIPCSFFPGNWYQDVDDDMPALRGYVGRSGKLVLDLSDVSKLHADYWHGGHIPTWYYGLRPLLPGFHRTDQFTSYLKGDVVSAAEAGAPGDMASSDSSSNTCSSSGAHDASRAAARKRRKMLVAPQHEASYVDDRDVDTDPRGHTVNATYTTPDAPASGWSFRSLAVANHVIQLAAEPMTYDPHRSAWAPREIPPPPMLTVAPHQFPSTLDMELALQWPRAADYEVFGPPTHLLLREQVHDGHVDIYSLDGTILRMMLALGRSNSAQTLYPCPIAIQLSTAFDKLAPEIQRELLGRGRSKAAPEYDGASPVQRERDALVQQARNLDHDALLRERDELLRERSDAAAGNELLAWRASQNARQLQLALGELDVTRTQLDAAIAARRALETQLARSGQLRVDRSPPGDDRAAAPEAQPTHRRTPTSPPGMPSAPPSPPPPPTELTLEPPLAPEPLDTEDERQCLCPHALAHNAQCPFVCQQGSDLCRLCSERCGDSCNCLSPECLGEAPDTRQCLCPHAFARNTQCPFVCQQGSDLCQLCSERCGDSCNCLSPECRGESVHEEASPPRRLSDLAHHLEELAIEHDRIIPPPPAEASTGALAALNAPSRPSAAVRELFGRGTAPCATEYDGAAREPTDPTCALAWFRARAAAIALGRAGLTGTSLLLNGMPAHAVAQLAQFEANVLGVLHPKQSTHRLALAVVAHHLWDFASLACCSSYWRSRERTLRAALTTIARHATAADLARLCPPESPAERASYISWPRLHAGLFCTRCHASDWCACPDISCVATKYPVEDALLLLSTARESHELQLANSLLTLATSKDTVQSAPLRHAQHSAPVPEPKGGLTPPSPPPPAAEPPPDPPPSPPPASDDDATPEPTDGPVGKGRSPRYGGANNWGRSDKASRERARRRTNAKETRKEDNRKKARARRRRCVRTPSARRTPSTRVPSLYGPAPNTPPQLPQPQLPLPPRPRPLPGLRQPRRARTMPAVPPTRHHGNTRRNRFLRPASRLNHRPTPHAPSLTTHPTKTWGRDSGRACRRHQTATRSAWVPLDVYHVITAR